MIKLLENLTAIIRSVYAGHMIEDTQIRRALRKEKADWQKARANIKEYRQKFKLIKVYKRAIWKQEGIKLGPFRRRPPYIPKDQTFGQVYEEALKWLEF